MRAPGAPLADRHGHRQLQPPGAPQMGAGPRGEADREPVPAGPVDMERAPGHHHAPPPQPEPPGVAAPEPDARGGPAEANTENMAEQAVLQRPSQMEPAPGEEPRASPRPVARAGGACPRPRPGLPRRHVMAVADPRFRVCGLVAARRPPEGHPGPPRRVARHAGGHGLEGSVARGAVRAVEPRRRRAEEIPRGEALTPVRRALVEVDVATPDIDQPRWEAEPIGVRPVVGVEVEALVDREAGDLVEAQDAGPGPGLKAVAGAPSATPPRSRWPARHRPRIRRTRTPPPAPRHSVVWSSSRARPRSHDRGSSRPRCEPFPRSRSRRARPTRGRRRPRRRRGRRRCGTRPRRRRTFRQPPIFKVPVTGWLGIRTRQSTFDGLREKSPPCTGTSIVFTAGPRGGAGQVTGSRKPVAVSPNAISIGASTRRLRRIPLTRPAARARSGARACAAWRPARGSPRSPSAPASGRASDGRGPAG